MWTSMFAVQNNCYITSFVIASFYCHIWVWSISLLTAPFTINDGLRLGRLLLLLPQGLGGFELVHLGATKRHSGASTLAAWPRGRRTVLVRSAGGGGFVGRGGAKRN